MKKRELIFFMSKKTKIVAIQSDKLKTINKDTDTSLLLALEAQRRGYKIYYYETENLNYRLWACQSLNDSHCLHSQIKCLFLFQFFLASRVFLTSILQKHWHDFLALGQYCENQN